MWCGIFILLSIALLSSCGTTLNVKNKQIDLPGFSVEAHRGGRGLMPENTTVAMLNAIEYNITTLEMDTHITLDNKVVLAHDAYINHSLILNLDKRKSQDSKANDLLLYNMSYDEVLLYDIGSKNNADFPNQKNIEAYIPLLSDVIEAVQDKINKTSRAQVFYNIEIKSSSEGDHIWHPSPEEFVDRVVSVIEKYKITPWVTIQSFDVRALQYLKKKYNHIRSSYLVSEGRLEYNLEKLGFKPDIYSPNYKLVDKKLINLAHSKNILVIPWTPNTLEEIKRLKELGVDGVISDYPNILN